MSLDNNSECVKSKYFAGQGAMDESLSDFQETKKSCKGPKPAQKSAKPKTRKVSKRIKGQKDIRTALKGKSNDLEKYSKEFDTVCKKSGLDVDSEQLQLAIALSKSLQPDSEINPECSQKLSSQQRVAKIRKTLQEYGFHVPEAKITANKRIKKPRKPYKLLTISKEEKHQVITEKYSQILFQNLDHSRLVQVNCKYQDSFATVFYVATNIPYESIKDNSIFYVDGLLEKSTTNGCLLRDWSEIPGRPTSPKLFNTYTMNFKDISCSQEELDVILSGTIKSVKNIVTKKRIINESKHEEIVTNIVIDDDEDKKANINYVVNDDDNLPQIAVTEIKSPFQKAFGKKSSNNSVSAVKSPIFKLKSPVKKVFKEKSPVNEVVEIISPMKEVNRKLFHEVIDVETNKLTVPPQYRSCSPDIFDDELSSIMETTKPINILSQEHRTKVFTEDNYMDLTQCANPLSQNTEKGSQFSQNVTKRKSNDFMEITECIVGSSQPIHDQIEEISLIQSPVKQYELADEINCNNVENNIGNVSLILTSNVLKQNPNNSIRQNITHNQNQAVILNLPEDINSSQQIKEQNIDLTQSSNEDEEVTCALKENNITPKNICDSMDLTQSSNSNDSDDLPLVDIGTCKSQKSLDETIIINEKEYIANGKVKNSTVFESEVHNQVFDLTQAKDDSIEYSSSPVVSRNTGQFSNSLYEDFVHDHSENSENSKEIEQNIGQSNEQNCDSHKESNESNDIDLTQDSETSEERVISQRPVIALQNIPNNSSLGKKDDLSIDYDEIINDNIYEEETLKENNENTLSSKCDSSKSEVNNDVEIEDADNECDINSSQNSEAFHISDKELDYSLHKSRYEFPKDNFDFGGISVLDNVTKLGSFRKSLSEGCVSILASNNNDNMGDSFLPEVDVKKTDNNITYTAQIDAKSPIKFQDVLKASNGVINIKTPKNTEYIIKTDNVTPMADYGSMTTPQRNRELEKYGLKPFKRKRAVQILTHLYNQTHPTIEQLIDEDHPSPSKKPRRDDTAVSLPNTPVKSPWNRMRQKISPQTSARKTDEMERDKGMVNTQAPSSKTPVKSLHFSPFKKLRQNSNSQVSPQKNNELERDGDILMGQSPRKTYVLERDGNVLNTLSTGYEVTSEVAVVSRVDCSPDDWVFQKREKAKIHSCRVPLHIAFHNYISSRRSLREAILKYEPVNIDVIHKDLVGYGHRYDPKDLLKFLDKKCITVKTTDNNARNNKR